MTASASEQLVVSEVMYDPGANEERWEWLEVHNTGPVAIDLDGYLIDRVGDRARSAPVANVSSTPFYDGRVVANPTVLPSGGIAILYPGPELGYDAARFRAAWPEAPAGTTFIGVEGWSANRLTNAPQPSEYAPSLPAMTIGFWADDASYQLDTADFGAPGSPNRRVFRTDHAAVAFGYDDSPPWPDTLGKRSLIYLSGDPFHPNNWVRTNAPWGNAHESEATFLAAPINRPEYGSPGVGPPGESFTQGLIVTEVMANAASITGSIEWEWIEVLNSGPAVDFANTPLWLDDDDGANLAGPNVTTGQIGVGEIAVFYNPEAATLEQMRSAWDRPGEAEIAWIAVSDWPALANSGDRFGFWDTAADYLADRAGETVTLDRAVAALEYDDSAPWPSGVDGDAIRLKHLATPPGDPSAWARARAPSPTPTAISRWRSSAPAAWSITRGATRERPATSGPTSIRPCRVITTGTAASTPPITRSGVTAGPCRPRPPPPG